MRDKILAVVGILFAVITVSAGMYIVSQLPDEPQSSSSSMAASAVKIQIPADFSGTWVSSTEEPRMTAKISGDRIEIMLNNGSSKAGYWYGTWETPHDKVNHVLSKAVDGGENGGQLYLSSAPDKDFLLEGGAIKFQFAAFGSETQVVLQRA